MPGRKDRRSDAAFADDGAEGTSHRSRFAQDRDRILYCAEFRRLAGVTQVAPAGEGAVFHNRLTHSIKVAQVGRRLAEFLNAKDAPAVTAFGGLDPDVVEAACQAHDIGHPPFGHAAEKALQQSFKERNIADGFEGNAQSFRIVTFLTARRASPYGLDLTRATTNAVLKYPWHRGPDGKRFAKWGAYIDDGEAFAFARAGFDAGDSRKSAEAELMEWADDVSYATHDLEDFYRAGLLPLDQLLNGVRLDELVTAIREVWAKEGQDGDPQKAVWSADVNLGNRIAAVFSHLAASYPSLRARFTAEREQEAELHRLTSRFLDRFLNKYDDQRPIKLDATAAGDKSKAFVLRNPNVEFEVSLLKSVTAHYVFTNPSLVAQQIGQAKIVQRLFDIYNDAFGSGKRRHLVPSSFSHLLPWITEAPDEQSKSRRQARAAADVVASLAEDQAHRLFLRLEGFGPGSLSDPILR